MTPVFDLAETSVGLTMIAKINLTPLLSHKLIMLVPVVVGKR